MHPEELYRQLHQQPFQPFRLHLSNGKSFDVRHPELAVVGRTSVWIGHPAADVPVPVYDYYDIVSLRHINNIEPLPTASTQTN